MPDQPAPSWSFGIAAKLRSMNEHSQNASTSRHQYRRERDAWGWFLVAAMREHGISRASERRRVVITRVIGKGERAYDYDNLVGGAKALVDAMVRAGLVLNDNARWLHCEYKQERGEGGVRVEVWEAKQP